jgi:tRNA(Arg) A34 adenosine deaminase TadA
MYLYAFFQIIETYGRYVSITRTMLSKSQTKLVHEAYNEAVKSPCYQKHGCVISTSGRIIGRGFNNPRTTSSDKVLVKCMTCHAEAAAIREVIKKYKREVPITKVSHNVNYLAGRNCTIYVVRVGVTGNIKRSDPCQNCAHLIKQFGIKRIVYSNDEGGFEKVYASEYVSQHCTSGFQMIEKMGV